MRDQFEIFDVNDPLPVEDEQDKYFFPGYWLVPALMVGIGVLYFTVRFIIWVLARVY